MSKRPAMGSTRAKRTVAADGREFPSKAEAARWDYLRMLYRGKQISDLWAQPEYVVFQKGPVSIRYTPDFGYIQNGETILEEVKGMADTAYLLRRKMFVASFPSLPLYEIRGKKRLRVYLTAKGLCRTREEC